MPNVDLVKSSYKFYIDTISDLRKDTTRLKKLDKNYGAVAKKLHPFVKQLDRRIDVLQDKLEQATEQAIVASRTPPPTPPVVSPRSCSLLQLSLASIAPL